MADPRFEFLLRMGDNALVLGHRISEWCGHAPALEEDIALANTALDFIGQAQMWLGRAAEVEGAGRAADDLAMRRDVWDFRSVLLVEQPNGDFGQTIMRQFLFDVWHRPMLEGLVQSKDEQIAAIAEKSLKEASYHIERSSEIVIRLGDGTDESHRRMQAALDRLYPYFGELFEEDGIDTALQANGIVPAQAGIRAAAEERLEAVLTEATLIRPETSFAHSGGKSGKRHSEHLGHLLTQMQWLQRAYPGATW